MLSWFNIILHGRDLEKLKTVQSKLLARFPDRECEVLVLDAAKCFSHEQYAISRDAILEATNGCHVTLLIDNVGIGHDPHRDFRAFTAQTPPSAISC